MPQYHHNCPVHGWFQVNDFESNASCPRCDRVQLRVEPIPGTRASRVVVQMRHDQGAYSYPGSYLSGVTDTCSPYSSPSTDSSSSGSFDGGGGSSGGGGAGGDF